MVGKLLTVDNLSVEFITKLGTHKAVDSLSFEVGTRRTLGIVGESGSGKSVTSLAIMGLLDSAQTRISGTIGFEDRQLNLTSKKPDTSYRGNEIAMIFQEPMTSLNPVHTCGEQIMEPVMLHKKFTKAQAKERAIELLRLTGIADAELRFKEYPHQMSGGMRQRIMIAMALACNPKLLIADEPTTALDVTIQAQILDLMKDIKSRLDMSIILISHDLGVIAQMCEDVLVMYAGQAVERAGAGQLFSGPRHPYTQGLLKAVPTLESESTRLIPIEGVVPDISDMPAGCRFHPRCPKRLSRCELECPGLTEFDDGSSVRCFLYDGGQSDAG